MPSKSDQSDGSRHSRWGRQHWEEGACMQINPPTFKDEDTKYAVTYQSWRWDLTGYQHAGCRDHTLLPYAIRSLQGYPGELVQSSGMDITLDEVLNIWMNTITMWKCLMHWIRNYSNYGWQIRKPVGLGHSPFKAFTSFSHFLPWPFSPRSCGRVEEGSLLWHTFQEIKSNGSLSEDGSTAEDILRLPRGCQGGWERRFDRVAPKLQNPNCWWAPKPRTTSFFPLRKLKGNQLLPKACCLLSTFGGRGGGQWQRSREWWSGWNQGGDWGVHGPIGKGSERCPSRWEMLLPLQWPWTFHP